jgi:acyl-CoA synthetase (AMP-forming)/AMP-acid ligase II
LRNGGVGRSDRVAVVLPEGPGAATAIVAVAAGAVCVPLYAGYTTDEWQRYFSDLEIAALLTRADVESASRGVAHTLGIPVIDLSPGSGDGTVSLVGSPTRSRRRTVTRSPAPPTTLSS